MKKLAYSKPSSRSCNVLSLDQGVAASNATPIYLDNHATTPIDPRVLHAMAHCYTNRFGNPDSRSHAVGQAALEMLWDARALIADFIDADASEVIFTSGATESNNLALFGTIGQEIHKAHLVISAIEHSSVIAPAQYLAKQGALVSIVQPDANGRICPQEIAKVLTNKTRLVCIQAANNEIGTLQPIREISAVVHKSDALFHVDAAQAMGKMPLATRELGIDLMSMSAHKIYGPKGVGALFIKGGAKNRNFLPQLFGGHQEYNLRAGTVNVPGAVGLAEAVKILSIEGKRENDCAQKLRDCLLNRIRSEITDLQIHGSMQHRLPGNLNIRFPGVGNASLLAAVQQLCLSASSACQSHAPTSSHVLAAIGLSKAAAAEAIRVGIGRFNTANEINYAAELLIRAVKKLR